ncbi:M48 family metalloprotease [Lactobacillus bombicola]|uniref:M48 family metalloprotease n=1 Tax=Lactobacillus bombicola TaxID=1505723 RepID=UPI000E58D6DF|nr:M48 family metalloprotease [Lactobacillus bombicola]RHW48450.1 hypothetical protein DS833_07945 [Lactobacillus bombicola]
MENLISYLLNYAFDRGVSYALLDNVKDSYPSVSFTDLNRMVINLNWRTKKELPFIIGHEIGHFANGDSGKFYYRNFNTPVEHQADLYSLNLIFDYATRQYDCFDEPSEFMQAYGIPVRMYSDVADLFRKYDDLLF